jgi:hypothetical protein
MTKRIMGGFLLRSYSWLHAPVAPASLTRVMLRWLDSVCAVRMVQRGCNSSHTRLRRTLLTIPNSAFADHLTSYQDAPDICSRKLRRELAAYGNNPPETRLDITVADLEDYRGSHSHRKAPSLFARKPSEDY